MLAVESVLDSTWFVYLVENPIRIVLQSSSEDENNEGGKQKKPKKKSKQKTDSQ